MATGDDKGPVEALLSEAAPPKDTPPKRGRPRGSTSTKGAAKVIAPPMPSAQLRQELIGAVTAAGFLLSTRDPFCGMHLGQNAEVLVGAWMDLAEQNPSVRRALTWLVQSSAWGTAITTTLGVALPMLQHHGIGWGGGGGGGGERDTPQPAPGPNGAAEHPDADRIPDFAPALG